MRPHEKPLRWHLPAALQMIRKSMKSLQTVACAIAFAVPHVAAAPAMPPESLPSVPTAPQPTYRSAFDDYKPYEDVPVADWRQANDTVRQAAARSASHAVHATESSRKQGIHGKPEMHGGEGTHRAQGTHGGHQ